MAGARQRHADAGVRELQQVHLCHRDHPADEGHCHRDQPADKASFLLLLSLTLSDQIDQSLCSRDNPADEGPLPYYSRALR